MSAYGAILRPSNASESLSPTIWRIDSKASANKDTSSICNARELLVLFHLTLASVSSASCEGLLDFLHGEFADEIDRGQTYPQETLDGARLTREAFDAYFFAADVIIGLAISADDLQRLYPEELLESPAPNALPARDVRVEIDAVRNGRDWNDCVGGFYYIKPNYPGRSSHICNAGFVTPHAQRGKGYATVLARSYLHYAPKLGYQASVFNLVFANNVASLRIWEKLGFSKAGLIPRAGRLKRRDGEGEEYVDAFVIYKSFLDTEQV